MITVILTTNEQPVTVVDILVAHQRRDYRGCICGWDELGKSHAAHQVKMLSEAGLLVRDQVQHGNDK